MSTRKPAPACPHSSTHAGASNGASPTDASGAPAASPAASSPLSWDAKHETAASASFTGKLESARGSLIAGGDEPFFLLTLDKPACDADGNATPEVQLASTESLGDAALKKAGHKHVRVEGESMSAQTQHHRRPIVVLVGKLVAE